MLGAAGGDIIGRPYEFDHPVLTKDFVLFDGDSRISDDTVLSYAVGHAALRGIPYWDTLVDFGSRYLHVGFAAGFTAWVTNPDRVQGESWANGSSMRVTSIGWIGRDLPDVARMATESAMPTHSHPDGIRGAVATASAVHMAAHGATQAEIRRRIAEISGYDLDRTVDGIRPGYKRFAVHSNRSVPEAIVCALEATSYEDAVRNAVSLGNDSDTQAAIAGAIAEGLFGIPADIAGRIRALLPQEFLDINAEFDLRTANIPRKTAR